MRQSIVCSKSFHRRRNWLNRLYRKRRNRRILLLKDLAIVENAMGHVGAALDAMVKASQISPNDGDLAAVLGFSYINLNRIPQAISPLRRAAKLLPRDYLVQSQLGYCLLVTGQTNTAIGYLQKGASLNSRYGPVWEPSRRCLQKTRAAS